MPRLWLSVAASRAGRRGATAGTEEAMNAYARLVMTAWATYAPKADPATLTPGEFFRWQVQAPNGTVHLGFPLGTRFAFRRDDHRRLRACFIEHNTGGYVRMLASYVVDEERPAMLATFYEGHNDD
jgi:hypothetical protein